jgi:hypothetical protein
VVTEKSEVYSFGMVLLEVLTGRPPAIQNPANGQIQYMYTIATLQTILRMVQQRARWPPELATRVAKLALACIDRTEGNRPIFVHVVARLRDLVSRSSEFEKKSMHALIGPGNFFQPNHQLPPVAPVIMPAIRPQDGSPNDQILENQRMLENALKKVNAVAKRPDPQPAPISGGARWNPFEDEESSSTAPVTTPPEQVIPAAVDSIERTGERSSQPLPPTGVEKPTNQALADFDEELRAMSVKNSEKTISLLFPPQSTEEQTKGDIQRESHLKEVARHLLNAGFTVDQIQGAIKRVSSVEAAVEWILEQNWD